MAIYHNAVSIGSRGSGQSACASSAYISCSVVYNDYDGVQHDYTQKSGLVWEQIFLPPMAPPEWQDRETLWNAVESVEKSKDNRLSRMHVVALPVELGKDEWISLLTEYIQTQFVSDGMCVDVAIHDTDGHNPHAHIMTTLRPLNPDGTWQHKTEKEYLCIRNGEERGFTAEEFKEARNDGWQKQYPYLVGTKKVYMPTAEGEAHGYERASKYAKSTKYGLQNPITARWNSEEQLQKWRVAWEDIVNHYLEHAGSEERIDHRSHAERDLDEKPTIHEGVAARIREKKGKVSDRCELNRQIRKDNQEIRYWKAVIEKLKQAAVSVTDTVVDTIKDIARKIENSRQEIITGEYLLAHYDSRQDNAEQYVARIEPLLSDYMKLHKQRRSAIKVRSDLANEYNSLSPVHILKRRTLLQDMEAQDQKITKIEKKEADIRRKCGKTTHAEMKDLQSQVTEIKTNLQKYPEVRNKRLSIIDKTMLTLKDLFARAKAFDPFALMKERKALRVEIETKGTEKIEKIIDEKHSPMIYRKKALKADKIIDEIECEYKLHSTGKESKIQKNRKSHLEHSLRTE